MTWLSLCSVRLTPRMPNTTKTIAPVSTRGRTAGWPHAPPLHGLKPDVLDDFALAAEEGSVKIEPEENLSAGIYLYCVKISVQLEYCGKNLPVGSASVTLRSYSVISLHFLYF